MINRCHVAVCGLDRDHVVCTVQVLYASCIDLSTPIHELVALKSRGDTLAFQVNNLKYGLLASEYMTRESYCSLIDSILLNGNLMQFVKKMEKTPMYAIPSQCVSIHQEMCPADGLTFIHEAQRFTQTVGMHISRFTCSKINAKFAKMHKALACFAAMRNTLDHSIFAQNKCEVCFEVPTVLFLCASCRRMRYCSEDCQRKSWKDGHKALCGKC